MSLSIYLSFNDTIENIDDIINEIETDPEVENVEKIKVQSIGEVLLISLTSGVISGLAVELLKDPLKKGIKKLKELIKRIINKINDKFSQNVKIIIQYKALKLEFTSENESEIEKKFKELLKAIESWG